MASLSNIKCFNIKYIVLLNEIIKCILREKRVLGEVFVLFASVRRISLTHVNLLSILLTGKFCYLEI